MITWDVHKLMSVLHLHCNRSASFFPHIPSPKEIPSLFTRDIFLCQRAEMNLQALLAFMNLKKLI